MLNNQNISDAVCVVTRYFGGILLGTGGIVRAYTGAAKLALEEAGIKKMLLHDVLKITVPYSIFDSVKYIADECGCIFSNCEYTDIINIEAVSEKNNTQNLIEKLKLAFGINIKIEIEDEVLR